MQVCMRSIEMIASFNVEGVPTPIRYKIDDDGESVVVNVDNVLTRSEEKVIKVYFKVTLCTVSSQSSQFAIRAVICINKKHRKSLRCQSFYLAGDVGVEPTSTVLETAVLPLN